MTAFSKEKAKTKQIIYPVSVFQVKALSRAVSELNSTWKNSTQLEIFVNSTRLKLENFQIKL